MPEFIPSDEIKIPGNSEIETNDTIKEYFYRVYCNKPGEFYSDVSDSTGKRIAEFHGTDGVLTYTNPNEPVDNLHLNSLREHLIERGSIKSQDNLFILVPKSFKSELEAEVGVSYNYTIIIKKSRVYLTEDIKVNKKRIKNIHSFKLGDVASRYMREIPSITSLRDLLITEKIIIPKVRRSASVINPNGLLIDNKSDLGGEYYDSGIDREAIIKASARFSDAENGTKFLDTCGVLWMTMAIKQERYNTKDGYTQEYCAVCIDNSIGDLGSIRPLSMIDVLAI
jgi:hypothetical protein